MSKTKNKVIISNKDYDRLYSLIEKNPGDIADLLEAELNRARIVSDDKLPADVIAMGSTAVFKRRDSSDITRVTLVYPADADMQARKISVLSPVGSALIGLPVGGEIDWPMPNGKLAHLEIMEVVQL
jgi:regulator of nucleoside diphosphate kinase